jgi:hypothetical protein
MSTLPIPSLRRVLLPIAALAAGTALPAQTPIQPPAATLQQQLQQLTTARASSNLGRTALYAI